MGAMRGLLLLLIALPAWADGLGRARELARKGNWAEARAVLEKEPKSGWVLTELAFADLQSGDLDAAIAAATEARELPGDHRPAAAYNLSLAWEKKGDRGKALGAVQGFFVTPAMADREAALSPPDPVRPAWTGPAESVASPKAWCQQFLKEHPREPGDPGNDTGPTSWRCSRPSSPSPAVPTLGKVSLVWTTQSYEFKGYEVADQSLSLLREAPGVVERVPLAEASSNKGSSRTLDRFRWKARGTSELLLYARESYASDYGDPIGSRGSIERVDELVWVVGLDDQGKLAAFGPIPVSRREAAEPGFSEEGVEQIPSGKPWKQAWSFDLRWDAGKVTVGELAGKPVPRRDRHRLGEFPIRFAR